MPLYEFTLIIEGPDLGSEGHLDALFEIGCDDATFGSRDNVQYGAFDREADSLPIALTSAITQVETAVPEARIVRVEPDEFVSLSVIAERTKRTTESIRQLYKGLRGPGGFPSPISWIDQKNKVWRWSDVAEWFEQALGEAVGSHEAETVAALNGVLETRRHLQRIGEDERAAVASFVSEDEDLHSLLAV